jgi:hypothetical protein
LSMARTIMRVGFGISVFDFIVFTGINIPNKGQYVK